MQYIRYVVHQTTGQLPEHEPAGETLTYTTDITAAAMGFLFTVSGPSRCCTVLYS